MQPVLFCTVSKQGRAETFRGAGAQSIKGAHGYMAFNRAVILADMCIEMDASVLIQQQIAMTQVWKKKHRKTILSLNVKDIFCTS